MHAKRQHFVPQFYLKNFAKANGDLWICRRRSEAKSSAVFKSNARKICVENNLYEIPSMNTPEQKFIEGTVNNLAQIPAGDRQPSA